MYSLVGKMGLDPARPTRKFVAPALYQDESDLNLGKKLAAVAALDALNHIKYEPVNLEKQRMKMLEEQRLAEEA